MLVAILFGELDIRRIDCLEGFLILRTEARAKLPQGWQALALSIHAEINLNRANLAPLVELGQPSGYPILDTEGRGKLPARALPPDQMV